jgi:phosphoribosylanthranilate isomerase
MKVKICGITRMEDAMAAVEAGAAAVGFVFVSSSRRFVTPRDAARIIRALPSSVTPVGVVADTPKDLLTEIVRRSGVRVVQFHGAETPEMLTGYGSPAYKAFRVGPGFETGILGTYPGEVVLLDAFVDGVQGGTGRSFDWSIAVQATKMRKVILAGGITPATVGAAIEQVRPFAVDVSSGVESSPGIKDRRKITSLFAAIRAAGAQEDGCLF